LYGEFNSHSCLFYADIGNTKGNKEMVKDILKNPNNYALVLLDLHN